MKTRSVAIVVLTLLVVSFVVALSWYTVTAFHKTNINRFDLGNIEQLIWNTTQGHGFIMTDPYGTATVSRFAFHVDPLLFVFVPVYALWPTAETLILVQILFLASGIVAAYLLGRHWLESAWSGLVAALVYAVAAPVLWAAIQPVHAVSLALPLILWMVWAAEQKKWLVMYILAGLVLLAKEQAGIILAFFGLWLWFQRRQRRIGVALIIPAVVWSAVAFFIVLPHYRPQAATDAEVYRSVFGSSATDVIRGSVTHPVTAARTLLGGESRRYIFQLISTTGGLAILNPLSLVAVPDLIINGLSAKPQQHEIAFHYHSTLWPWLFAGGLLGWAWLLRWSPIRWRPILRVAIPSWLLLSTAVAAYLLSPLPGSKFDRLRFATWGNRYAALVQEAKRAIPANAALTTTNNIGSQFAQRQHLYLFPRGIESAAYAVILERHAPGVIATDQEIAAARQALANNPDWKLLSQNQDLSVWQRVGPDE